MLSEDLLVSGPWRDLESGVVALGHLAQIQLGKMLQPISSDDADMEVPYLNAGLLGAAVSESAKKTMFANAAEVKRYAVVEGDLLVTEGGDVGRSEFAPEVPESTIFQNSLHRVRSTKADIRFLKYSLDSIRASGWLDVLCNKATFAHLTYEKLCSLPVPVQPLARQQTIADYLDRETARIDTLIAKKQQFIELLKQRYDALIRDTVSGIGDSVRPPWLPAMASDRRLIRLGSVLELRREKNSPVTIHQVLSLTADRGVILYEDKGNIGNKASEDISRYSIVRVGDIVMNSMNVIIGSVGLSKHEGVLSPVYYVMRPIDDALVDRRFLAYHFKIREFQRQLVRLGYGILDHRMRIPWANLKTQEMVLPPHKTQTEVADVLDEAESTFRSTLAKVVTSVELLRERRQAVITAAVTGELLVPEAAA